MKKSKLFRATSLIVFTNFSLFLNRASAQITGWIEDVDQGVGGDLAGWIPTVINLAIGLAALVCVAVLIGAGYMYITAGGDEAKIEKASKSITYAVVGLVICFISVILVQFVLKSVLGQQ